MNAQGLRFGKAPEFAPGIGAELGPVSDGDVIARGSLAVEWRSTGGTSSDRDRMVAVAYVRGTLRVAEALRWSAETPHMYTLLLIVRDNDDTIEVIRIRVGFRTVDVRGGRLLVNGAAVTIAGVNRHEHDPSGGHVVTPESMSQDIQLMKVSRASVVAKAASDHRGRADT